MSNKRTHQEYNQRRTLQNAGWQVRKRDAVGFNGGSETLEHHCAKAVLAWMLKQQGYRVDTEVVGETGEIDIVAYGQDGPPFAVEVERNPDSDVIADKLERYYRGQPFRECFVVDPDGIPLNTDALKQWANTEVG